MRETPLKGTGIEAPSPRQSLLRLVREACEALLSTQPSIIESVTVSRVVEDRDGARLAKTMAARLAQEYGLDAEATTNGMTVVVRLSRPAAHLRAGDNPSFVRLSRHAAHSGGQIVLPEHMAEIGY